MADQYRSCLEQIKVILDDPTVLMEGVELTERKKQIFRLCTLTDMNHHGVAYVMNITMQTVKNHLTDAKDVGAVTPTELRQMVLDRIKELVNESLERS